MTPQPTVNGLDASIAAASPVLDDADHRTVLAIYRLLAAATPASAEAIAGEADVSIDRVRDRLGAWPGIFTDAEGNVVGFWGIAIPQMPHRLRFGDAPEVHAWCAWDPLFIAPLVGDAVVDTTDPVTKERIRYRIGPDGVADPSHENSVVSFLVPDGKWDADVIANFCHYVLHFATRDSGERWVAAHPGTFLLSLRQAAELGRLHAERIRGR